MARTAKTSTRPRPAARSGAGGGRGAAVRRGRTAVKRRDGDRRTSTIEGRRQETKRPRERPPEPHAEPEVAVGAFTLPTLTDEERIESAKYLPRHVPKRVFEEERFLFPDSYGVDRVRLLVRDPDWLFAYWDLDPRSVESLRREVGARGMALTRLTLRITDPSHGGTSVVLLPTGARAWYVRADVAPRSYRAQLGWTLPSGRFRLIAESNLVATPRTGPSPELARLRLRYDARVEEILALVGAPPDGATEPWRAGAVDAAARGRGGRKRAPGGASDVFGPGGASDVFRPGGASDVFRR
ncbi:MAG TPA: DUF4912 domain-containing protein [Vicinamibacteria bacterium]|nr:DUF4912 domain-containing protein [Vicinamibacteria bacterium]